MAGISRAYKRRGKGMEASVTALAPTAWFDAMQPNALWQDIARTIPCVVAGDKLRAWSDRSGNSRHAILNTGADESTIPFLESGHHVLLLPKAPAGGQSSAKLDTPVLVTTGLSKATIIGVIRSQGSTYNVCAGVGVFSVLGSFALTSGINDTSKIGALLGGYTFAQSSLAFSATLQTISARFDFPATTLDTQVRMRYGNLSGNPLAVDSPRTTPNLVAGYPFTIFGRFDSWRWKGSIAEIMLFLRSLSDDENNVVHAYLQSKWSVV